MQSPRSELIDARPDVSVAFVLDDENQVGSLLTRMLGTLGVAARAFSTLLPFLREITINPPDLLVLDLALGHCDAVEVIHYLKVLKFAGKVLLISGRDEATLREIQHIGASHGLAMLPFMRKPFRLADLARALATTPITKPAAAPANATSVTIDPAEALEKGWLELWYQPKIDLRSVTVCGAEGLLRARHPEYGVVGAGGVLPPPGDPLYEPLSRFVIGRAMANWAQLAARQIFLKLAVNVPASVLVGPDFVDALRLDLPKHPRFPGLILELTEDEVFRDVQNIREIAARLKLYNVQLSLDDFGSGYSSLSRLHDVPFVELKLDRSFVSNCSAAGCNKALCEASVDLAHRFGATACAEGVENPRDLQALTAMGCDVAQGFLFAKPMSVADLAAALHDEPMPAAGSLPPAAIPWDAVPALQF